MAIRSDRLVVSLISDQGYYTYLYGYAKHNREGGRMEETNKYGLGQLLAQEEEFRNTFCTFCEPTRACTRAKLPQKPLAMLTSVDCVLLFLLTALSSRLIFSLPFCWLSPSSRFCWPPSSGLLCQLTLSVFSGTLLPASSSGLVGDIALKPFVWVSRQNRQMDRLTDTHTHLHNGCTTSRHSLLRL